MIDIETEVFDACAKAVNEAYPDALVTSKYLTAPASFPAISIIEVSNTTDTNRLDSSFTEQGAELVYEVRSYSNKRTGAKKEARGMLDAVDGVLFGLNFRRTINELILDSGDPSLIQIVARYRCGVDAEHRIYWR